MPKTILSKPELDRQLERIARRAQARSELEQRYGTSRSSKGAGRGANTAHMFPTLHSASRGIELNLDDATRAVKRQRRIALARVLEVLASLSLSV